MSLEERRILSEERIQEEAAQIFTRVRNIPYVLGTKGDATSLLRDNKGHCTSKHFYLLPKLRQLGYKTKIGIATFDWRDMPQIPKEITSLLHDPIDKHLFLFAQRNNREMVVDASWDPGMPEGFPINSWNGYDQTKIGVPYLSIQRYAYPVLTARVTVSSALHKIFTTHSKPTPFNDAFNEWIGRKNL